MTYGVALFVIAAADSFSGFLVGMAISGLGFGIYLAVDLALVTDVLPDAADSARDLGRLQHRQRPAVRARARCRARHPRCQRRQLLRPVRRRRGLCPPGGRCGRSDPRRALTAPPVLHHPVHHVW